MSKLRNRCLLSKLVAQTIRPVFFSRLRLKIFEAAEIFKNSRCQASWELPGAKIESAAVRQQRVWMSPEKWKMRFFPDLKNRPISMEFRLESEARARPKPGSSPSKKSANQYRLLRGSPEQIASDCKEYLLNLLGFFKKYEPRIAWKWPIFPRFLHTKKLPWDGFRPGPFSASLQPKKLISVIPDLPRPERPVPCLNRPIWRFRFSNFWSKFRPWSLYTNSKLASQKPL